METNLEYEDGILRFFIDKPDGYRQKISKLTDYPDRFIAAVKKLMDEKWLCWVTFSNDYQFIKVVKP